MSGSILIVEDNDAIRGALVALLQLQGYTVEEAANGKQALAVARERPPDLILLDLMMPVMDGWTFLDIKEHDPTLAPIPVVVNSAVGDFSPPRHAAIVDIIDKALDLPRLLTLARQCCAH